MEYRITTTNSAHRKKAHNEYIVALNNRTINKNKFGNYVSVKNLFTHVTKENKKEIRCLSAICRLISDDSLDNDEVAIDQTLRNVIGKYFKNTLNELVKIENIKVPTWFKLRNFFNKGQYLYTRVFMASLLDMEKPYVRINEDSLNIIAGLDGRRVWIENNVNEVTKILDNMIDMITNEDYDLATQLLNDNKNKFMISINKSNEELKIYKYAYYYDLILNILNTLKNKTSAMSISEIKNIFEIIKYNIDEENIILHEKVTVHTCQDIINSVNQAEKDKHTNSFESPHLNPTKIFKEDADLPLISLDAHYRYILHTKPQYGVRIKRVLIDVIKDDIIEYGLVFLLTIFSAAIAINSENFGVLPLAIIFSLIFTIIIMIFRGK